MIRSFGCSWLSRQPWTTASSDHVRRRSSGRGASGAIVSIGSVWSGTRPVGAPFPARAAGRPPRDPGLAWGSLRFTSTPLPCGGGWVGCTTEPWGCVGGCPRLGGTPVLDETVAAGCHATGCGPDPPRPSPLPDDRGERPWGRARGQVHDQQEWGTSRRGAAQVPIPLITPQLPGAASGRGRDHSQSSGTQIAVVSSGTGVPPRRGRPPEQPHDSVVHPTQPPP
jgi:hypothetical protein